MSASKPKTVRLSHALCDAGAIRAKELGYTTLTALIEGLLRYDCLTRSKHGVTICWAKLSPVDQDSLDAKLFERTLVQKGMKAAEAAKVDWKEL